MLVEQHFPSAGLDQYRIAVEALDPPLDLFAGHQNEDQRPGFLEALEEKTILYVDLVPGRVPASPIGAAVDLLRRFDEN